MFELSKHKCKIAHLNIREETHGEDKVLAEDIKIQADVPNDFLSYLAPTLKWSLYDKPDAAQGELIKDDTHMPRLRYSQMANICWRGSMAKAAFVIHGTKKSEDLVFEATVDKLVLDCKDGGTVAITFRASVYPTAEESGRLSALLGQEHKISVRPGDATSAEGDGDEPKS
jgi:hypothetical protein